MEHFKDIVFGRASAEQESAFHPELIVDGFLDPWNVVEKARNGPEFLFLGYKGSGKSTIGQHLLLTAENDWNLFVTHMFLSDFPYGNFAKIVTGDAEPESRFPSAWQWLLTLTLLGSIAKDYGIAYDEELQRSLKTLKSAGLLSSTDLKEIVVASSRVKYKIKLLGILDIQLDPNQKKPDDLQFLHAISRLRNLLMTVRGSSKHLLILDGLDDILLHEEIQYKSIAALILETARLNQLLMQNNVPAKIIVLCRTELFERLPGPNKNKIRQDSSVELDWYHNPSRPGRSKLVHLVNKRAQLADKEIKDIFIEFFPIYWQKKKLFLTFLLDHTRHTPRDFLQLLAHIQGCLVPRGRIERNQILAGIRNYSSKYFLPEILDELVGYVTREQAEALIRVISRSRRFHFRDLSTHLLHEGLLNQTEMLTLLKSLFDCSAIGNLRKNGHWSFKYRNRHSHLNPDEQIVVHRGLWRAMNIN